MKMEKLEGFISPWWIMVSKLQVVLEKLQFMTPFSTQDELSLLLGVEDDNPTMKYLFSSWKNLECLYLIGCLSKSQKSLKSLGLSKFEAIITLVFFNMRHVLFFLQSLSTISTLIIDLNLDIH